MTFRAALHRLFDIEWLNVAVTNYIPRRAATRLVGRLAKVEHPVVRDASIRIWRMFSDLDLSDAKKTQFTSLHDCFVRELKDGARPVDERTDVIVSPCDGIIGQYGRVDDGVLLQVKGSSYLLADLVRDPDLVAAYRDGTYVTLRLTAAMYHRFHAPADGRIAHVAHIAGDALNVNPPTLKRIARVYCRNERAVIQMQLAESRLPLVLVPVAAILVAGLRLRFVELPANRAHDAPWRRGCDVGVAKGDELGWFEHGSTIILLAPPAVVVADNVEMGATIRMGQALLRTTPECQAPRSSEP
jgi:phosphatidylserine decarboxylase